MSCSLTRSLTWLANSARRPSSRPIRSSAAPIDTGPETRALRRGDGRGADGLERGRVADRDLREHLAVQRDVVALETADQARVALAERADGGVDALDPQAPEVALALLAAAVGVHPRVLQRLHRDRVAGAALAAVAAGRLEDAVAATA